MLGLGIPPSPSNHRRSGKAGSVGPLLKEGRRRTDSLKDPDADAARIPMRGSHSERPARSEDPDADAAPSVLVMNAAATDTYVGLKSGQGISMNRASTFLANLGAHQNAGPIEPRKSRRNSSASVFEDTEGYTEGYSANYSPLLSADMESQSSCGARVLRSTQFNAVMAIVIVANALVIGLETDSPELAIWNRCETSFFGIFMAELALKLIFWGMIEYFDSKGADFLWNCFDFVIVGFGLIDFLIGFFGWGMFGQGSSLLRMVRLLRILRIFRIVRFLRQLYMLAFGFVMAVVAVFWVTVLMGFVLYSCAIVLVRTLGHVGGEHEEFLSSKFGTVPLAMLSLFELMSSPDLIPYQDVLFEFPAFTVFVVGFIVFGSFGMIALLTGVISETMFEKNTLKMEQQHQDETVRRQDLVEKCELLFDRIPKVNVMDEAAADEVSKILPELAKSFEDHGVPVFVEDLEEVIQVMDQDNSGTISKDEFNHFIVQLAEGVRPMLIMELYYSLHRIDKKLDTQEDYLDTVKRNHDENLACHGRIEHLCEQVLEAAIEPMKVIQSQIAELFEIGRQESRVIAEDLRVIATSVTELSEMSKAAQADFAEGTRRKKNSPENAAASSSTRTPDFARLECMPKFSAAATPRTGAWKSLATPPAEAAASAPPGALAASQLAASQLAASRCFSPSAASESAATVDLGGSSNPHHEQENSETGSTSSHEIIACSPVVHGIAPKSFELPAGRDAAADVGSSIDKEARVAASPPHTLRSTSPDTDACPRMADSRSPRRVAVSAGAGTLPSAPVVLSSPSSPSRFEEFRATPSSQSTFSFGQAASVPSDDSRSRPRVLAASSPRVLAASSPRVVAASSVRHSASMPFPSLVTPPSSLQSSPQTAFRAPHISVAPCPSDVTLSAPQDTAQSDEGSGANLASLPMRRDWGGSVKSPAASRRKQATKHLSKIFAAAQQPQRQLERQSGT